jgi:hypothetical protein
MAQMTLMAHGQNDIPQPQKATTFRRMPMIGTELTVASFSAKTGGKRP